MSWYLYRDTPRTSARETYTEGVRTWELLILSLPLLGARAGEPDVRTIIERSVEANEADWKASPAFSYFERDRHADGTKTYEVRMILGSPYQRLIAVNGKPIPEDEQKIEQQKLEETVAKRRNEPAAARRARIAGYEKQRKRDHLLMQQLTVAFDFTLVGRQRLEPYNVYVLRATPRPDYHPPNLETEVLTGMQGELWIDQETFQWVKVEARVVSPVYIEGFLARVLPGTRFELEKMPVEDGIWLPRHFSMKARAKVLFLFTRRTAADETYFGYHRTGPMEP